MFNFGCRIRQPKNVYESIPFLIMSGQFFVPFPLPPAPHASPSVSKRLNLMKVVSYVHICG